MSREADPEEQPKNALPEQQEEKPEPVDEEAMKRLAYAREKDPLVKNKWSSKSVAKQIAKLSLKSFTVRSK